MEENEEFGKELMEAYKMLASHAVFLTKNIEEAEAAIKKFDRGWYSDHAVRYREGRKIFWLVKCEWHC